MVAPLGVVTNSGQLPRVPAKHGFHPNGHVKVPPLSETVEIDSPVNGTLQGPYNNHSFGYKGGDCKFPRGGKQKKIGAQGSGRPPHFGSNFKKLTFEHYQDPHHPYKSYFARKDLYPKYNIDNIEYTDMDNKIHGFKLLPQWN